MADERGVSSQRDRARDQNDHARDHSEKEGGSGPREFAKNYPDPLGDGPLQVWPLRVPSEFESRDDFFTWLEAFDRWRMGKPPPRDLPRPEDSLPGVAIPRPPAAARSVKSRHVGLRLTEADYELLAELARAHSVPPGTMARMLVVRGARAAAGESAD